MFKNTLFLITLFLVLTGCYQSTASLIGPTVTLGTSGNIVQSAISYSVNESVKKATGKYPVDRPTRSKTPRQYRDPRK